MSRFFDDLKDQFGRAIAGAQVYVYTQAKQLATLTADGGGALTNPVTTSADGSFYFNADDGLYTLTYKLNGRVLGNDFAVQVGEGLPLPDSVVLALAASGGASLLGSIRPEAGAIARTVRDVQNDRVSVLDFIPKSLHAAIRDGTDPSNHTTYFHAALATGKEVLVPAGSYNANIVMPNGGRLIGEGLEVTTLRNVSAAPAITIDNTNGNLRRIQVSGMMIRNRDKAVYTETDGIYINGPAVNGENDYHTFSDLLIFQFRFNVHIKGRSIWNRWVHCSFVEAIFSGFFADADENQALQQFDSCRFAANGRYGLQAVSSFSQFLLDGWTFINCNFENNLWVPIRVSGTFGLQNWTFLGCYGEENARNVAAGSTLAVNDIVKSGFLLVDCPYAIGLKFDNCTFAGNTAPDAQPDYFIYVSDDCVNVVGTIENCRASPTAGEVISVYWKAGLDFGVNFGLTYDVDRRQRSRAAIESIAATNFTPGLAFSGGSAGIAYTNRVGSYVVNGGMVTFQAYVSISSKGSSTGSVRLTGLPFPAKDVTNLLQSVRVVVGESTTTKAQIHGQISPGSDYIEVQGLAGTSIAALTEADLGSSSTFRISGSYML